MAATTQEQARKRVAAGVAFLDKKSPGWRKKIDLRYFNVASGQQCVLGQLHGSYGNGIRALGLKARLFREKDTVRYGFTSMGGPSDFRLLTEEWKLALAV